MKKSFTQLISVMLAIVLLLSNAPIVFALESDQQTVSTTLPTQTNPLYPEETGQLPVVYAARMYAAEESQREIAAKCTSDYDLIVSNLVESMENRVSRIPLYYCTDTPIYTSEEYDAMDQQERNDLLSQRWITPLFEAAFAETDSPVQGDYLRWSWNSRGCSVLSFYDKNTKKHCYKFVFTLDYHCSKEQEEELTEEINKVIGSFHFTPGTTDGQKIAAIYDYITENITYDYDNLPDETYSLKHTAYAALMHKTAVCQGYALLYYRMAKQCGVATRLISGWSGGPHAWNISKLGNYYYNLDTTWDAGREHYDYFLKGSSDFLQHTPNSEYQTTAFQKAYPLAKTGYTKDPEINPESSNFTYKVKDDATIITGYTGNAQHLVIPSVLGNHPVTTIDSNAFAHSKTLITITIADTITTIGTGAFYNCTKLGDVYYTAGQSQWDKISIGSNNGSLTNANLHLSGNCNHVYSNGCDTTCNNCTAFRSVMHNYADATCTKPITCKICSKTKGDKLGHDYASATCTAPKTCKTCKATSGSKLGHSYTNVCDTSCNRCNATRTVKHDYKDATCTAAKTCKVCKATSGKALGHKYTNACDTTCNTCSAKRTIKHDYKAATCTKAKTCKVCGKTSGSKLGHSYKTTITKATLKKNGKEVKACSRCDKVSKETTIYKIKTVKLSTTEYTYNGKAKKPSVTVKDSKGNKLKKDTDYTVTYDSGRKKVGEYEVKVKFKGDYSGSKTLTFEINPKGTTVSKLTAKSKALTVKLNKQTTQTTGYQIQYATSSKFTSAKKVTVSSNKTTSKTIKSLKKGKKYYVRVRTYKVVDGVKFYSDWSKPKSMKTK